MAPRSPTGPGLEVYRTGAVVPPALPPSSFEFGSPGPATGGPAAASSSSRQARRADGGGRPRRRRRRRRGPVSLHRRGRGRQAGALQAGHGRGEARWAGRSGAHSLRRRGNRAKSVCPNPLPPPTFPGLKIPSPLPPSEVVSATPFTGAVALRACGSGGRGEGSLAPLGSPGPTRLPARPAPPSRPARPGGSRRAGDGRPLRRRLLQF